MTRRPVAFLAANLALAVAAGVLALGAPERLAVGGGLERGGTDSGANTVVVLAPAPGTSGPVARQAESVVRSGLLAQPDVRAVRELEGRKSREPGSTVLVVESQSTSARESQRFAERVASAIDPGPFTIAVAGEPLVQAVARARVESELGELALLVAPLVIVVLLLGFGARHAGAPALAAASGALGGIALLRLLPASLDLTAAGLAVAAAVGLAIGVEASHLIRREHLVPAAARDVPLEGALRRAVPSAVWACAGAALAAAALFAIPLPAARSAALGGILAALLAGGSALVAMPSLLALTPGRPPPAPADGGFGDRIRSGRLGTIAGAVACRRWLAWIPALAALAALVLAAAPAFDTGAVALTAADLGPDAEPAAVARTLAEELGPAQAGSLASPSPETVGDAAELIRARLPWIVGLVTAVGLLAAFRASGSLRLAVARGIGSALPASAACGLLVLAAEGSLPFEPEFVGAEPSASMLLLVIAAVAAVSVARAALAGLAGAVAGTLVAGPAMAALAGVEIDAVAQAGVAIAAGLVIDVLLVRAILTPSLERALPTGPPRIPKPRLRRPHLPDRLRR